MNFANIQAVRVGLAHLAMSLPGVTRTSEFPIEIEVGTDGLYKTLSYYPELKVLAISTRIPNPVRQKLIEMLGTNPRIVKGNKDAYYHWENITPEEIVNIGRRM